MYIYEKTTQKLLVWKLTNVCDKMSDLHELEELCGEKNNNFRLLYKPENFKFQI